MAEIDLQDIYARHRQGLFTLALSVTGCAARAEDAVHDAFARLCRGEVNITADAIAYVFRSVRNAAITQMRRPPVPRGPAGHGPDRSGIGSGADAVSSMFDWSLSDGRHPEPLTHAIDMEQERSIADAVDALPQDLKEIVLLRVYSGLTFAQIASVVGAPLATVATRYRRGLERLRPELKKLV